MYSSVGDALFARLASLLTRLTLTVLDCFSVAGYADRERDPVQEQSQSVPTRSALYQYQINNKVQVMMNSSNTKYLTVFIYTSDFFTASY